MFQLLIAQANLSVRTYTLLALPIKKKGFNCAEIQVSPIVEMTKLGHLDDKRNLIGNKRKGIASLKQALAIMEKLFDCARTYGKINIIVVDQYLALFSYIEFTQYLTVLHGVIIVKCHQLLTGLKRSAAGIHLLSIIQVC